MNMEINNKTNPDFMLRKAMRRSEEPSPELLSKVKYNTIKERPAVRSYYRSRRIIAIAATIGTLITLSTIAIAANTFGLRDMIIPNPGYTVSFDDFPGTEEDYRAMSPDGTLDDFTVPMDELLLAGIAGSPEYEAAMEWRNRDVITYIDGIGNVRWDKESDFFVNAETGEFVAKGIMVFDSQETLDSTPPEDIEGYIVLLEGHNDDIPEIYKWYGAFSWADVDKLNEIVERHGLVLYGEMFDYYGNNRSWNDFQDSITNEPFVDNSNNNFTLYPGYRWESGTFQFDAQYGDIWFQLRSSRKGTFDTVIINNIDISEFSDEWVYENANGTKLVLVQSANQSFILADTKTAFIAVSLGGGTQEKTSWDGATILLTRNEIENFADLIDFNQLK